MNTLTPYDGSLMRLAFTTIAIIAGVAAALTYWQERSAHANRAPTSLSRTLSR